ncbi:MAG: hypothetical protein CM15mP81_09800 [Alphaproteobacteria bacterium]|nr:MAG: hypothetical protein CM15mP81_09800 [Alphaproteobacteria bacterium]
MINENLFKKSISFWNLKNDEFELLAHRENITYKVYDLKGSCFVLRFHRKITLIMMKLNQNYYG